MGWLSNLFQSIVFQTVMSGVLVFILSEITQRFYLEPLQKFKEVVGKIDNKLKFYANVIAHPGNLLPRETILESGRTLRDLSCGLEATYKQIPFKRNQTHQKIADAARRLIRLSNSLGESGRGIENSDDVDKIRVDLSILEL